MATATFMYKLCLISMDRLALVHTAQKDGHPFIFFLSLKKEIIKSLKKELLQSN